jgi:hypothetical protein
MPGVRYPVLAPNMEGFDRAVRSGAEEIAVFTAASETFSKRNTNCSINESIARLKPVTEQAKATGIRVRAYVSCVLGCPYEGDIEAGVVADICTQLMHMGCDEVSLGDTIGTGQYTGLSGCRGAYSRFIRFRPRWLPICQGCQREYRQRRCSLKVARSGAEHRYRPAETGDHGRLDFETTSTTQ